MDQAKTLTYRYDDSEDILYVSIGSPIEAICLEEEDGVLIRVDPDTDEVVGFTIIDFLERTRREPQGISVDVILKCALSDSLRRRIAVAE